VYGLAVAGQRGVAEVLSILSAEVATTMALLGVQDIASLGPANLV
jgi:L-lactate dehydrogenase (cytochrome)